MDQKWNRSNKRILKPQISWALDPKISKGSLRDKMKTKEILQEVRGKG